MTERTWSLEAFFSFENLQNTSVVDGAIKTQRNDVKRDENIFFSVQ